MINGTKNDIKVIRMSRSYQIWWNNRTKTQRKCLYAIAALLFVSLLFTFFYLMFNVEPNVCTSSTCVRTSMEILNHIDQNMNPCDDFYRFACGKFVQNTNIDNYGAKSVQDIMEDEIQSQIKNILEKDLNENDLPAYNIAKKFYRACMNESTIQMDGLKRIKQIFKQIGGWPTLDGNNWRESQFDWKRSLYRLRRVGINFEIFFTIYLDKDKTDPNKYVLNIGDPRYSPSEVSNNVKTMYLDYMVDVAMLFGANIHKAKTDSMEVFNLLLKLAQISEDVQNATNYNPLSISELQYQYNSIPWYQFINNILSPLEKITYDDIVSVTNPIYLKKVEQLLLDTPSRTIANFICWHTLQQLINYLPAEILDRAYEFLGKVNGKVTRKPRWYMCVKAVEDRMNSVISAAYVEQYFDEETRQRVIDVIRNIKNEFKHTLLKLNWLDERTKHMAIEKLVTSVEEIVTYKDIIDSIEQSTIYDYADVKENEFLNSALSLDIINLNYKFGKLRQRVQDSWIRDRGFVTGLNIIFSPKENVLRFPVGLFRGIYYQNDRPNYMNYGVLGSIIAHEISHIFIQVEYRDLMGELRSWWSTHSLFNYDEKLQCLSNQYGKFIIPELGKHLNSSNTRDEDLADLAGMKVAYDTYINLVEEKGSEPILPGLKYTPNQLFWISSAIRHCSKYTSESIQKYLNNYQQSPKQFRVNGPLQNLYEFSYDFGCAVGTKMNPQEKCIIW